MQHTQQLFLEALKAALKQVMHTARFRGRRI